MCLFTLASISTVGKSSMSWTLSREPLGPSQDLIILKGSPHVVSFGWLELNCCRVTSSLVNHCEQTLAALWLSGAGVSVQLEVVGAVLVCVKFRLLLKSNGSQWLVLALPFQPMSFACLPLLPEQQAGAVLSKPSVPVSFNSMFRAELVRRRCWENLEKVP